MRLIMPESEIYEIWHVRYGREEPLLVVQGLTKDAAEKIVAVLNVLVDQDKVPGLFYMVAEQDDVSEGMFFGSFPYLETVTAYVEG